MTLLFLPFNSYIFLHLSKNDFFHLQASFPPQQAIIHPIEEENTNGF